MFVTTYTISGIFMTCDRRMYCDKDIYLQGICLQYIQYIFIPRVRE